MDRANELKLGARATALGESADAAALTELTKLTRSSSARVWRLAASAIGKLAGIVPEGEAVEALLPLLQDEHPQCRQYAAKALGAFGAAAEKALPDLRDLFRNPSERDYVKRSVVTAGKTIREAVRVAESKAVRRCRRCGASVNADEYARSRKAFQRVFCDKCFDEVYLERRNFDTEVELNKTIRAADGTLVQSDGERIITEWLAAQGIAYRYDERIRIVEGYAIRPDFYLPEFDVYIEYWGMDTTDYKIGMLKKRKLYQQEGKRLVSLHFLEKARLPEILGEKLKRYARVSDSDETKPAPAK
ncbi:MAG: HEAT repeat domain-containing protein [Deltaproteobacteria bacterium]|nr:HEAT repeat domain-containing protein [Deltaproteobacteria bacterium]